MAAPRYRLATAFPATADSRVGAATGDRRPVPTATVAGCGSGSRSGAVRRPAGCGAAEPTARLRATATTWLRATATARLRAAAASA
ncbi:MAG: hypothetical protein M3Z98_01435 [Candidatus Dormibacteraeota bacterium]|nr:hypothetical protein [Candidatus Dormibacteraeota bacterium]